MHEEGNGYRVPFEKMLDVSLRQTEQMTRLVTILESRSEVFRAMVETMAAHTKALQQLVDHIEVEDDLRIQAVREVKASFQVDQMWWRKMLIVLVIIIATAQILGIGLSRVMSLLFKTP